MLHTRHAKNAKYQMIRVARAWMDSSASLQVGQHCGERLSHAGHVLVMLYQKKEKKSIMF